MKNISSKLFSLLVIAVLSFSIAPTASAQSSVTSEEYGCFTNNPGVVVGLGLYSGYFPNAPLISLPGVPVYEVGPGEQVTLTLPERLVGFNINASVINMDWTRAKIPAPVPPAVGAGLNLSEFSFSPLDLGSGLGAGLYELRTDQRSQQLLYGQYGIEQLVSQFIVKDKTKSFTPTPGAEIDPITASLSVSGGILTATASAPANTWGVEFHGYTADGQRWYLGTDTQVPYQVSWRPSQAGQVVITANAISDEGAVSCALKVASIGSGSVTNTTSSSSSNTSTSSTNLTVGKQIVVSTTSSSGLNTRSGAGTSAPVLCQQSSGSRGEVVSGPVVANGYTWWEVDYGSGCSGWSAEPYLKDSSSSTITPYNTTITTTTTTTTSTTSAVPSVPSSVDIKAGVGGVAFVDSTLNVNLGSPVTLSWRVGGTGVCYKSSSPVTEFTGLLTPLNNGTQTTYTSVGTIQYKITCGSLTDSVIVNTYNNNAPANTNTNTNTGTSVGGTTSVPTTPTTNTFSTKFTSGDTVQTSTNVNVRSSANGTVLGVAKAGTSGTVETGPIVAGGISWWKVNFSNGYSGWSAEDYLAKSSGGSTTPTTVGTSLACSSLVVGTPVAYAPQADYPWGPAYYSGNPRWREVEWRIQNGISILATDLGKYFTEYYTAMGLSQNLVNILNADGTPFAGPGGIPVPSGATLTNSAFASTWNTSSPVFEYQSSTGFLGGATGSTVAMWHSPFSSNDRVVCPLATPLASGTTTSSSTSSKFVAGDTVRATSNVNVRSSAGTSGAVLTTVASGTTGSVVGGPTLASSMNWWQVSFSNGYTGWSSENYLTKTSSSTTTAPSGGLQVSPTYTGSAVATVTGHQAPSLPIEGAQFGHNKTSGEPIVVTFAEDMRSLIFRVLYEAPNESYAVGSNEILLSADNIRAEYLGASGQLLGEQVLSEGTGQDLGAANQSNPPQGEIRVSAPIRSVKIYIPTEYDSALFYYAGVAE